MDKGSKNTKKIYYISWSNLAELQGILRVFVEVSRKAQMLCTAHCMSFSSHDQSLFAIQNLANLGQINSMIQYFRPIVVCLGPIKETKAEKL